MSNKRARKWSVCVTSRGTDRRYELVKPGAPLRGFLVFDHAEEIVAQLTMHAGSYGLADGSRVPHKGTLANQRTHLRDLSLGIVDRRYGRAA